MIKNLEQCMQIQRNRVRNHQIGYAKAVRRYISRVDSEQYKHVIKSLPVNWAKKDEDPPVSE